MDLPSEQKSIGIDELLNKLKRTYEDESKTSCEACRNNFRHVMQVSLKKGSGVSLIKFPSIRKGRSFLNCGDCTSTYELQNKARRAKEMKIKRFNESFKSNREVILEQYETTSE
jgi:hypothetical protein